MKSRLIYWLTYAGMWLLALLPFKALYALSDGLCFLMHHVVHYRRRVVRTNLRHAFPEKSETELRDIERGFYQRLYAGRGEDAAHVFQGTLPAHGI